MSGTIWWLIPILINQYSDLGHSKIDTSIPSLFHNTSIMKDKVNSSNSIYGLGLLGALIYYISTASSFIMGVWGVIKAFLWPAFLVFELLKYLSA